MKHGKSMNADRASQSRAASNQNVQRQAAAQFAPDEEFQGKFVAQQEADEEFQGKFVAQQEADEEFQGKFVAQQEADEEFQGKFVAQQEVDEEFQGKFVAQQEADEEFQGKFDSAQLKKNNSSTVSQLEGKPSENKTGMPDNLKSGIENLSGIDVSDVRVHYNSSKPAQMNAHAFAQGTNIHVASGQEKHVPHEAWHTVQQKQGRVSATTEVNGTPVNDSVSLETEADVMGAKANKM